MKTTPRAFTSLLAEDMAAFLAHKRALKRRYLNEEAGLHLLDRYLVQHGVAQLAQVTPELINAFLGSRPRRRPRSYNHLLGVVRCLCAWLMVQGRLAVSPVQAPPRPATSQRLPFLFDPPLARQLLAAAAALPDNNRALLRGPTYEMAFALLYGLGLRVGEVARLCWQDIDHQRQLLVIRHTKFGKSRLVPFGPKLASRLEGYRQRCEQAGHDLEPAAPVLTFTRGRSVCPGAITQTFHQLLPALQLTVPPGVRPPCAHSLRHSFAVGALRRWYEAGLDPGQRLLQLSTFLGHASPDSTAVYLTITEELLQQANLRFAALATGLSQEATP
jgi:integrase